MPQKPFRILDLPREVRNRIYGYALQGSGNGSLTKHTVTIRRDCNEENPECTLELVSVNRQIYDEALPFLYNSKIFTFKEVLCIAPWLQLRSAQARQAINHIRFKLDMDWMNLARSFTYSNSFDDHLLMTQWKDFIWMCIYVSRTVNLKTLEIEFTGTPNINCQNFHEDFWARNLYRITNLERLSFFTKKKVIIDQNSVAFMKAKMEKPNPSSAASKLLSLPAEVRWNIYEHLLMSKLPCYHKVWFVPDYKTAEPDASSSDLPFKRSPYEPPFYLAPNCRPHIHPEILATCKQIHKEATAMLYIKNNMDQLRDRKLLDETKGWVLVPTAHYYGSGYLMVGRIRGMVEL